MKKTTLLALVVLAVFSALAPVLAARTNNMNSDLGVVWVFVKDEDGSPARHVPIYIVDARNNLHILESGESGVVLFDLVIGKYTISSAIARPIADSVDRYISASARILVLPDETTSLVLTLHLGEDALARLSLPTLVKMGVAKETAKYLNLN